LSHNRKEISGAHAKVQKTEYWYRAMFSSRIIFKQITPLQMQKLQRPVTRKNILD